MRLHQLPVGSKGRIVALRCESDTIRTRLNALGIVKGESVEMLKYTLAKNTYEVRVGQTRLALRKEEAEAVEVAA